MCFSFVSLVTGCLQHPKDWTHHNEREQLEGARQSRWQCLCSSNRLGPGIGVHSIDSIPSLTAKYTPTLDRAACIYQYLCAAKLHQLIKESWGGQKGGEPSPHL